MAGSLTPRRTFRRLVLLALGVLLVHGVVLDRVLNASMMGWGQGRHATPEPIQVSFVHELTPQSMVPASPSPEPVHPVAERAVSLAATAPKAASAPSAAASEEDAEASDTARVGRSKPVIEPEPQPGDGAQVTAVTETEPASAAALPPLAPASAASAPVAFDWPPSTRLNYSLNGYYRGPLQGSARVEWLRSGFRYQVRLTVTVPPIFERRIVSSGLVGPDGLVPERFDQETDPPLMATRRESVLFEDGEVLLVNGKRVPTLPGIQDTASQFVQITWMFLTQPQRAKPGSVVDFPLALPRRVGRWRYTVEPPETLTLPFGDVQVQHLQPHLENSNPREPQMQIWVAPSLQYLPVKILLRMGEQDASMELLLRDKPLQADR